MKAPFPAVAVLTLSLGLAAALAQAETVYRCGNTYSQTRCASGTVLEIDDARSPEQKKQTEAAARRDAQAADAMEKARLRQASQAAPAFISPGVHAAPEKPVKPEKHTKKTGGKKKDKKPAEPFTATDGKVKVKSEAASKKKKAA